ncbi:aldose 1-epimerase family protein [Vibrio scophthalmi]|uniref:aldose 1-epimerase family protein n=1 Tax=Vibrio scophthalmi TaxID=45658 RepID=UPI003EBB6B49
MFKIPLYKDLFKSAKTIILQSEQFEVTSFSYNSGIQALEIKNAKGKLVILPFMGQMIWDAEFLGIDMCMKNMFSEPKSAKSIVETYGCFSFHSGLLRNGCPGPEDDHPLHGEMACAAMDSAWLVVSDDTIILWGSYEYVMGFGDHYLAKPSLCLKANESTFEIRMDVTNLGAQPMPLQYMCHMNAAYFDNAKFSQNIPDEVIKLRESVPEHVKPTPQWLDYNETLKVSPAITVLEHPEMYDPEIVYFMDKLSDHTQHAKFEMVISDQHKLVTVFDTTQFDYATRWVLYNSDQSVGAYVLPATCRPEGYNAAKNNGSLIYLAPNETRNFTVKTGISVAV